jgi:hypothetical protein
MLAYWLILFIPWIASLRRAKFNGENQLKHSWGLSFQVYFVLILLLIGLRHQTGGDWVNYLPLIDVALEHSFWEYIEQSGDKAYYILTWLSARSGFSIYGVNFICGLVFSYGLIVFSLHSPQPWLSLAVAVPYLVIVVAMGYTRQGVAIGLIMLGLVDLEKGHLTKFLFWVILAALFHKTALILIPMAIFAGRTSWMSIVSIALTAVFFFFILLAEHVDSLVSGYITDQYSSSGASIRIAMNALPAFVFIIFRKRFNLTGAQSVFWIWMSLSALIFIGLLFVSPSSTAVDRMALYWIPLQLYVWSRFPAAMAQNYKAQLPWVIGVLIYSFAVQFVWLFYADNRMGWLPYQFLPWVWLWE